MTPRLVISAADREVVHEILDDVTLIGRDHTCAVRLRDPLVSPVHCEIRRVEGGFKVVDLESREGTVVNGRPVNQHFLRNGDTIRLGEVRLSYLGPSSRQPAPPAPPVPMRSLPVGDNGEPRRFYRHEGRRRSHAPQVLLALLGGAAAVGLVVWALARTSYGDPQEKDFAHAKNLLARGDKESLEAAIAVLRRIDPDRKYGEEFVRDALREAESEVHRRRVAEAQEAADRFYAESLNHFRAHPEEIDFLPNRLKTFRERWPEDPRIPELERLAETARLGGPEKEAAWRAAETSLRQALLQGRFAAGFAELARVEADPTISQVFRARIQQYRSTLERAFAQHYEKQVAAALDAKGRGDRDGAARILRELAESGIEPQAGDARRLLDKLR
jgi:FimV-like protein